MDEDRHQVWRAGREVRLSPTEFRLLRYFLLNPERVLSKQQILDHVWQYDFNGEDNVVETYMSYLRRKIDARGAAALQTVRGFGYVAPRRTLRLSDAVTRQRREPPGPPAHHCRSRCPGSRWWVAGVLVVQPHPRQPRRPVDQSSWPVADARSIGRRGDLAGRRRPRPGGASR